MNRRALEFHISVRLDMDELTRRLTGPQIHALMSGIAQVLSASPYREIEEKGNAHENIGEQKATHAADSGQ